MKRVYLILGLFFAFLSYIFLGFFAYFYNYSVDKISVRDISYKDKTVRIGFSNSYGNIYCAVVYGDKTNTIKWERVKDGNCNYKIKDFGNYNIYIKKNNSIRKVYGINKVLYVSIDKDKYYLAVNDSKKIVYTSISIGYDSLPVKSDDESIAYVKNGVINATKSGTTKIRVGDKEITVIVTDLIDKIPKKYNYKRPYLSCGAFSKKEAVLLDEILFDRVKDAGEGTRAGVVSAARFLTLEFPYRISYFSENGRLGPPYSRIADGEGRYYHKGLYLSSDKYKDINPSIKGPKMWGCSMYSKPSGKYRKNGLDCSGFTTWAILNGGFDIGDLPAHAGKNSTYNLNDIGKEVKLTRKVALSGKIKAGDLLGEVTVSEGHSALVVGIDDDYYYVAESLWISPLGVNINKYKKGDVHKYFETVNLMDSYYKKQGNYTAMWY